MNLQRLGPVLLIAVMAVAGCASTGAQSEGRKDQNKITPEEIQESKAMGNVYSMVQRLRPNWLRKRGRHSMRNAGDVIVYVGGARFGGPQALREVEVSNVEALEFLSPSKATNRFGGGHDHGAILVHMKGR